MSKKTVTSDDTLADTVSSDFAGDESAASSVLFDPIMVVAVAQGAGDEAAQDATDEAAEGAGDEAAQADSDEAAQADPDKTVAVWQVETDPTVTRGDFSGAWIVTKDGVQGFAATADWIDERHDQAEVLATLLRYPVLPAEGTTAEQIRELVGDAAIHITSSTAPAEGHPTSGKNAANPGTESTAPAEGDPTPAAKPTLHIIDKAATEDAARAAIDQAKDDFARLQSGKKQPAWGQIDNMIPVPGHSPEGHNKAATSAIDAALASARGLRTWLRAWQAFDKTRARRLGQVDSSHSEQRPAPLT